MTQDNSYLERAIKFHSDKVKLYESINNKFLYGIFEYEKLYSDLFSEKEFSLIIHYCFTNTSSVKAFFDTLESQLIEHGAIRMRRKKELEEKAKAEKDQEIAAKFKALETKKKDTVEQNAQVKQPEKSETTSKWGQRFSELEAKLKSQKASSHTHQEVLTFRTESFHINSNQDQQGDKKLDEKKFEKVSLVVHSLYEKGNYSLQQISKLAGVDLNTVKRILAKKEE
jgi:hypothetical protein